MDMPRTSAAAAAVVALLTSLVAVGAAPMPASAAVGDEVVSWVEVEDGAITGGAAGPPGFNSGDHSNFSGTGSYTFRETGMTSSMSVSAPAAGTYPVWVRYAAGTLSAQENVTRSMGLLTNGGDRQIMQLPLTGDWETWKFVRYDVSLVAGANTVALQCDRDTDFCRLNFDAIQVGGTAPDPCVAVAADPGYTSLYDGTLTSFDRWRKAGAGGFGRQTDCSILSLRGRGAEWFTPEQTAPYTLTLDWLRTAADDESSVYVGSRSRGGADPSGGVRIPIGTNTGAIQATGETAQPADPSALAAAMRPVGQWSSYTIQVTRTSVAVFLNGVLVNSRAGLTGIAAEGFVGLENRGAGSDVRFRDIQLKPGVAPDTVDTTTSVALAPGAVLVDRGTASVSVRVSANGRTPAGEVEVFVDGRKTSTLTLREGMASTTIGPFSAPGTRSVQARYLGDTTTRPSISTISTLVVEAPPRAPSTTAPPTVARTTPTVSLKVRPKKVVAGRTRAKIAVNVSAPGGPPTGVVTLRVGSKTRTGTLSNGKVLIRLPKLGAGTIRFSVTYVGDIRTTSASAKAKIKVVRATGT